MAGIDLSLQKKNLIGAFRISQLLPTFRARSSHMEKRAEVGVGCGAEKKYLDCR